MTGSSGRTSVSAPDPGVRLWNAFYATAAIDVAMPVHKPARLSPVFVTAPSDVSEVWSWADANRRADEERFVYVVSDSVVGLVRLAGTAPRR